MHITKVITQLPFDFRCADLIYYIILTMMRAIFNMYSIITLNFKLKFP